MKKILAKTIVVLNLLFTTINISKAQDTIIVNLKVGSIIDSTEKARYRILPYYSSKLFINAAFIRLADSTIQLRAKLHPDSTAKKQISKQEFDFIKNLIENDMAIVAKKVPDPGKDNHRYIGLGIRAFGLQLTELLSTQVPPNRIVLNIDPHKYFRIEGQFGIYKRTSETKYSTGTGTVTLNPVNKSTFFGFGLMGLYPKDNARFIGGLRYSINNYSDDTPFGSGSPPYVPYLVTNKGKMTLISGIIGGEYFFAKFFSIGAEFTVSSIKDVYKPYSLTSSDPNTTKTFMTEGNLIFRFFPF